MRLIAVLAFCVAMAAGFSAQAHSHVASSDPKADAVLADAPDSVKLTFHEVVRPEESSVAVIDGSNKPLNTAPLTASDDHKTLIATLPPLESGKYTVKWKAVCMCADHHATRGSYQFTVE